MRIISIAAGMLFLGSMTTAALALPTMNLNGVKPAAEIELVNGRHSACAQGPAGWHYHVRGQRISCEPRPQGRFWRWYSRDGRTDWWNWRDRRWR